MSELTDKDVRERMAELISQARTLRHSIHKLAEEAAAEANSGPLSAEAQGWESLANCLGYDWEAAESLVDDLDRTLEAYNRPPK